MQLWIGTSGFGHKEWKGLFYPADMPLDAMLRFYGERFDAVEINNSFYRMPSESMLAGWLEDVPENFRFTLKAVQTITHRKRLKEVEEPTEHFFRVARTLGPRLGPILVQLPPNLKKDMSRLESFLDLVPEDHRVTFEFRHPSWFESDALDLLRARGAALCVAQDEKIEAPREATADWGYLRLRRLDYSEADLAEWGRWVQAQSWREAFVFFMHEETATGPRFAEQFARSLAGT